MRKIVLYLALVLTTTAFAQRPGGGKRQMNMQIDGEIYGKVIDKDQNAPIEYANIAVYRIKDSSLVSGGITNRKGVFSLKKLPAGRFYMTVKFIGYNTEKVQNVMVTPRQKVVDAGTIKLEPASIALAGAEVVADKIAMQYKIDKKVINVSQIHTSASGSAVDILEKTPSVTVDIEGNVEMRGSSNFTVLIDGRPSPFEGSDALEQIPATSIENIEIITNPSAKYDPEGTAGIINVITKKSKLEGFSGITNVNVGLDNKYGGDVLINYRTDRFNAYVGGEYNHRMHGGERTIENETFGNDTSYHTSSTGAGDMLRKSSNLKAGLDVFLTRKTTVSANVSYGTRDRERINNLDYEEWATDYLGQTFIDNKYTSDNKWVREGDYLSVNSDLTHKFNTKGHELVAQFQFRDGGSNETNTTNLLLDDAIANGQRALEQEKEQRYRMKVDYTLPFGKKNKFEAGWQSQLENATGSNDNFEYDLVNENYVPQPLFSHATESFKNIHALYSTISGEYAGFGFKAGLRGEYTDREISLTDYADSSFALNRIDLFPTAHVSYQLPNDNQVMASYTRRIRRPRDWFLEPFMSYMDAYNIRAGNPNLKPQYINSYEAGWSKKFGRSFVSLEGYYRHTINKMERTRERYQSNIMFNSFDNVGEDHAVGIELMSNIQAAKWWNFNLTGSVYNYKIVGVINDLKFSEESLNWNTRVSNTFSLFKGSKIQLDGMYVSPSVSAQGRREGFYMVNTAIKQDFFKRKLAATLQVRDIFGTAKHEFYASGPDFKSYMEFKRKSPTVMLTLTYKFNNYKNGKRRNGNGDMNGDSGDIF